nr:alpha/beta fold hydrolase [Mammaliicoccus sp. Marseille-Q6498]
MLKLKEPHSIFLKGGKEAVLLLHSFTGTVRDVKDLATTLNQEGFTCYVPAYKGHGLSIEGFIEYNTNDWWKQVEESYQFLKAEGYDNISVLGVSLGGLMSLKLAETNEIKKCIVMSAPNNRTSEDIKRRLLSYGERINQIQGLNQAESEKQLSLIDDYEFGATVFMELIEDIMSHLQLIKMPISIMYGEQDQLSYHDSAEYVYSKVGTSEKTLTSYEKAGHLMTRSEDKVKVEKDIVAFLKS